MNQCMFQISDYNIFFTKLRVSNIRFNMTNTCCLKQYWYCKKNIWCFFSTIMSRSCKRCRRHRKRLDRHQVKTGIVIIREKSWSWTGIFFVVLKPLTINRLPSFFCIIQKGELRFMFSGPFLGGWCCSPSTKNRG